MKKTLLAWLILSSAPFLAAQEIPFQPGHVHSVLDIRFSPDGSQALSFSASDDRLCLWDVQSGRLLWMTAIGFVQKRYEYYNLKEFYWSENGEFIVTKSMNGTWQTWDAKTGRIVALGETEPGGGLISLRADSFISDSQALQADRGNSIDASIRITDLKTGKTWRLEAHPGAVQAIAFSPDGTVVAAAGADRTIYLFDVAKRAFMKALVGHSEPVHSLSFSPDGNRLLSGSKATEAKLWDWKNGKLIQETVLGKDIWENWNISFSPDGKSFLSRCGEARDGGALFGLWDALTLKRKRAFVVNERFRTMMGSRDKVPVRHAAFLRDGKEIIAAYADDTLRIWDAHSGRALRRLRAEKGISRILPGPDENTILVIVEGRPPSARGDNSRIRLLDSETGRSIASFTDLDTDSVETLAFSPDGKYLAVSHDEAAVLLRAWDGSRPLLSLDVGPSGFDALAFSPDSGILAVGGVNQNLQFFNVETGAKLWQLMPFYQPGELEARLSAAGKVRRSLVDEARARRDRQAAVDTEEYKNQVYLTFEHYGEMISPLELRFGETGEPDKSRDVASAKDANAVWLRLHNDSPLPIKILTHSMYLDAIKCVHEFAKDNVLYGLCPDKEISIAFEREDTGGKALPRMSDRAFVTFLLPRTSTVFAVPLGLLERGDRIKFDYSFQNAIEEGSYWTLTDKYADYGTKRTLKFGLADIPRAGKE